MEEQKGGQSQRILFRWCIHVCNFYLELVLTEQEAKEINP